MDLACNLIANARHLLAVTGAGVSVESGIPPFRGSSGLWDRYDPETYASLKGFLENPRRSWDFFLDLIDRFVDAVPNDAHKILAAWGKNQLLRGLITQNIDGLHITAGSRNVIEIHGSMKQLVCMSCGQKISTRGMIFDSEDLPPMCTCSGVFKPEAVLFGESIPTEQFFKSLEQLRLADVVLFIGTSGLVHPVNQFPEIILQHGGRLIEINPEETLLTRVYQTLHLEGGAADILVRLDRCLTLRSTELSER